MNVLIITPIFPPDIGGPATYVQELKERLPNSRINPQVITFTSSKVETQDFASLHESTGNKIIKVFANQSFWRRQWQLFGAVKKQLQSVDVCYIQGTLTVGLAAALGCYVKKKPYVIKYVGDEVWEAYQKNGGRVGLEEYLKELRVKSQKLKVFEKDILLFLLQKSILRNAKAVITPGKELQQLLKRYYEVDAEWIPNAIEKYQAPNTKYQAKQENSIIYIGRLVPWKNIDQVLKAFKVLAGKSKKSWTLTIVGSGSEDVKLKDLVKNTLPEGLQKRVLFKGQLSKEESLGLLNKSEYLVLYSSYEGLSHTLLEAMATKTKIITSDIPANRFLLDKGELGKLVPLNSIDRLADSFEESYPQEMLNIAKVEVEKNYSWEKHINELLKVLHE